MTALLDLHPDAGHPAVAGAFEVHALLDRLDLGAPLSAAEHATAVAQWSRAISRMEAVRLKLVASADRADVAAESGSSGTDAWLSQRSRRGQAHAVRDVRLASALDTGHAPTGAALDAGDISPEHAAVIVGAVDRLPEGVDETAREEVEAALVIKATSLDPAQLRRVARRALAAVEPDGDVVDEHAATLLRDEEAAAWARTRLTLHDGDDGTTTGHFTVPTLAGSVLRKVLQAMTAPRRHRPGASAAQAGSTEERLDWAQRNGQAFVELLEHLPTDHLHPRTAVTVVATIDQTKLVRDLGVASLDTAHDVSAGDLRRTACNAGILPAVLDGASRVLDLGRSRRLFSEAQRLALGITHHECCADGCERPFAWSELHHRRPWSVGGHTDLADAVPLCGFHHRRIHDRTYTHRFGPGGEVTFHRRT